VRKPVACLFRELARQFARHRAVLNLMSSLPPEHLVVPSSQKMSTVPATRACPLEPRPQSAARPIMLALAPAAASL